MPREPDVTLPSRDQLVAIIRIQSEMAKHGLDLAQVMSVVVDRALDLVKADGAVIELAEKDEMVYRAVSGVASGQLGLRLKLASSLSGSCVRSGEITRCIDTETDSRERPLNGGYSLSAFRHDGRCTEGDVYICRHL